MKSLALLLTVFFIFPISNYSQDIPEPDYYNQPYFLNSSNRLERLEATDANYGTKFKAMGYGTIVSYISAFDRQSPKRFSSETPMVFIIKLDTYEDPGNIMRLLVAQPKKKKRRFITNKGGWFGREKDIRKYIVPLQIERIGDQLFKIRIEEKLAPGEYAFEPIKTVQYEGDILVRNQQLMYCFGVD